MGRLRLRAGELALLLILSPPFSGQVLELTGQETDIKTAKKTQEEAIKGSNLSDFPTFTFHFVGCRAKIEKLSAEIPTTASGRV